MVLWLTLVDQSEPVAVPYPLGVDGLEGKRARLFAKLDGAEVLTRLGVGVQVGI